MAEIPSEERDIMKWEDVFDKSFNIKSSPGKVIVFLPGTYTGSYISYVWTTLEETECGVDLFSLPVHRYGLYGTERERPGDIFSSHQPMKTLSQEERVCQKIVIMEERWKKFQAAKKVVTNKKTKTRVKKDRDGRFVGYEYFLAA